MTEIKPRSHIVVLFACLALGLILAAMTLSCSGFLQGRRGEATKSAGKGQEANAPEAKEETQGESPTTPIQGAEDEAQKKRVFQESEVNQKLELIKEVKPEYPDIARHCGYEAIVVLKLVVDESGDVARVEILHSRAREFKRKFEAAAIAAVKQFKFKPAMVDGKPVWCSAKVTINFRLT